MSRSDVFEVPAQRLRPGTRAVLHAWAGTAAVLLCAAAAAAPTAETRGAASRGSQTVPAVPAAQVTQVAQGAASLLAAAEVRIGVERLAKLHFEGARSADAARAERLRQRERERVLAALALLREDRTLPQGARTRVSSLGDSVGAFVDRAARDGGSGLPAAELYGDSEALAARITFVSTALSARGDVHLGTLVDLVTRAAATAQRLGKVNFARASGLKGRSFDVDASQSLIEFRSALDAIDSQQLDERTRGELELAQHQWILLRAVLDEQGLAREGRHLRDLAGIADHMAEALLALARRSVRAAGGVQVP